MGYVCSNSALPRVQKQFEWGKLNSCQIIAFTFPITEPGCSERDSHGHKCMVECSLLSPTTDRSPQIRCSDCKRWSQSPYTEGSPNPCWLCKMNNCHLGMTVDLGIAKAPAGNVNNELTAGPENPVCCFV